jgi:hypothetical protein
MAKQNPLIAAVLKEIPGEGSTRAQRIAWLKMAAMAMDNVYGVDGAALDLPDFLGAPAAPVAVEPAAPVAVARPQLVRTVEPPRFFIDHSGVARLAPSMEPITPEQLGGDTIFDDRGEFGDLGSIQWADGRRGVLGLQINISATPASKRA